MKPTIIEEDIVTLTTDDGVIVIKLDSVNCPKHSENFKKLVKEGFYDGTPIPTNDIWIAALALEHSLVVYTRDTHFDHLPQIPKIR